MIYLISCVTQSLLKYYLRCNPNNVKFADLKGNTVCLFFFYQSFLSKTLSIHRTAGEGRGPSFIPLSHFHPLMNIQTFILKLCTWDDYLIFLIALLVFTRWDLPPYRITIWLIDDVMLISLIWVHDCRHTISVAIYTYLINIFGILIVFLWS